MIYIFIGTIAELIKLFPVLKEFENRNLDYQIISSGQNDLTKSDLVSYIKGFDKRLLLSYSPKNQSVVGLLAWFIKTFFKGLFILKKILNIKNRNSILIVHGDTISTLLGALLGRLCGLKIYHIEAGLRSFKFFRPFPEEACRVITSFFVNVSFCPNDWALNNLLKKNKQKKINTFQNTLYESQKFALNQNVPQKSLARLPSDYFIFVLHRQENIYNYTLVKVLINKMLILSQKIPCIFILHNSTEEVLKKIKLLKIINNTPNVYIANRLPYIEFTGILKGSEFIITDGGSNQEEAHYLKKPCLILRKETERIEGIGENAELSYLKLDKIDYFLENFKNYKTSSIRLKKSPSQIIADYIEKN